MWFCSLNAAHFKTILLIRICIFSVRSCRLYGRDGSHLLEVLNGIFIICYWYLYGVTCRESKFSFGLVSEAMHGIPDYVTVLDEEHAITSPHHFMYRRSGDYLAGFRCRLHLGLFCWRAQVYWLIDFWLV